MVLRKVIVAVLGLLLVFSCFAVDASAYNYPNGTAAKAGDILVTSDAYSKGIVGHTGIVTSGSEYLETRGEGYYPQIRSLSKWFDYKGKPTKVVRISNSSKANAAGLYARLYEGSRIPYKITMNLLDSQYTYCSKLVYQAYAFGTSGVFPILEGSRFWGPYNFLQRRAYKDVTPRLVYSKGMWGKGDVN